MSDSGGGLFSSGAIFFTSSPLALTLPNLTFTVWKSKGDLKPRLHALTDKL